MKGKYTWTHQDMHEWLKDQTKKMKNKGIPISTASASKLLYDQVIVPNQINLPDLLSPKKLKKKKKWKQIF